MRRHIAAVILLALGTTVWADDHFVVVFGAETRPPRPKYSHSWAAFVRRPAGCPPEVFTISWLPRAVELEPLAATPEPGTNFDLDTTFRIVLSQCEHVSAWGPYQVTPELYCLAARHKQRLESGAIEYKTIDLLYNPMRVSNCIHALTAFNRANPHPFVGRYDFGEVASYQITDGYRRWMCDPCREHCEVAAALGLGRYPIRWRRLADGRPWPLLDR